MKPPKITEDFFPHIGPTGKKIITITENERTHKQLINWYVSDGNEDRANLEFFGNSRRAIEVLNNILSAHESKNNGAVMGEAVLCKHFETAAKEALKACGYTEYGSVD